jgi:hypothetical protein
MKLLERWALLVPLAMLAACATTTPTTAANPPPPSDGTCDDGALLGKASENGRVACAKGRVCVSTDKGPTCVAEHAAGEEACGLLSCGEGCSCASAANSECLCPRFAASDGTKSPGPSP